VKFEIGAAYRRRDIHAEFGGQRQGGISTPAAGRLIFIFSGEAGHRHGYHDEVTEEGFLIYGEGQLGDMTFARGNLAIRDHRRTGKRLLIFQATGKGKPCIYRGEYVLDHYKEREGVPDTNGEARTAIIFLLRRLDTDDALVGRRAQQEIPSRTYLIEETTRSGIVKLRTKQALFRDRLERIEKGCRVTGITDGRFLRASHIKPWSVSSGAERVDGANGLLLAPHIDHLFDNGWITFEPEGTLLLSPQLPKAIIDSFGLVLPIRPKPTRFFAEQERYLAHHRKYVFKPKS